MGSGWKEAGMKEMVERREQGKSRIGQHQEKINDIVLIDLHPLIVNQFNNILQEDEIEID